jgi:hypothetical protein
VTDWSHEVIAIPETVEPSPRMAEWYEAYHAATVSDYRERVAERQAIDAGERPYAGVAVCRTCHAGAYSVWEKSGHARAFPNLEAVDKQFDPFCVKCHTVGFLQPGGFLDGELTSHLKGVQCESCHGPSAAHAAAPDQARSARFGQTKSEFCATCHMREHSPAFTLEGYWPRIAHTREGEPPPKTVPWGEP